MTKQDFNFFHRTGNYLIEVLRQGDVFSVSLWHVDEDHLICELCDLKYTSSSFDAIGIFLHYCTKQGSSLVRGKNPCLSMSLSLTRLMDTDVDKNGFSQLLRERESP